MRFREFIEACRSLEQANIYFIKKLILVNTVWWQMFLETDESDVASRPTRKERTHVPLVGPDSSLASIPASCGGGGTSGWLVDPAVSGGWRTALDQSDKAPDNEAWDSAAQCCWLLLCPSLPRQPAGLWRVTSVPSQNLFFICPKLYIWPILVEKSIFFLSEILDYFVKFFQEVYF